MTILFFSRLFYPHIGGVEKHVFEISKRLIKKGHKVIVITENYQSLSVIDNVEGIKIIRINAGHEGSLKKFTVWFNLIKYFKLIKSADIIHCHDIFFWYLPFRCILPFKKNYTTFHGYEGNNIPNKQSIFMHKLAEKLSYGNICIGGFYKKWYGTNPTYISFGAVEEQLIENGKKIKKPNKDIMFLGRLENETGFMKYLKTLKRINLKLDVFGEGSLEKEARKYVKDNGLRVNFKGFLGNATDYIPEYKYVFTSRYLGILEAMALKRPVFAEYGNKVKKDYLQMTPFAKYISISKNSTEIIKEFNAYKINNSNINLDKAYDWVKDKNWEGMVNIYSKLWKF